MLKMRVFALSSCTMLNLLPPPREIYRSWHRGPGAIGLGPIVGKVRACCLCRGSTRQTSPKEKCGGDLIKIQGVRGPCVLGGGGVSHTNERMGRFPGYGGSVLRLLVPPHL